MASTSTQIASSFSSSIPRCTHDAFLSFRGKDTRNSFTDLLHYVLTLKGIKVFRDEKLERGKKVGDGLLKAIQESRYAIVVISANYASSRWCLTELAEIVECIRRTNLTVLPIFYRVNPFDVRNQTGTFAEAFARHEKNPKVDDDKLQKWRAALNEVGNISGCHVDDGPESIVVEEISRKILYGLSHNFSNVSKGLVGIKSRMEEMESILAMGLDDVRFLGICGMGGIGKTTLAKVIYESIAYKFEASCFIPNIREQTKKHGLLYLQIQLISQILGESETNIQINPCVATNMIERYASQRRVLIILDNIDENEQVNALAGRHDWFGPGSRIIITSRDRHLLDIFVDKTYEVKELNDAEALQLFSWKAFKKPYPEENYVQLSMDIVNYAQGLPLALEVFGSLLFGRTRDEWKSAIDLLKENPNAEILDKLKISYDGLEDLQQKLFLDIACFFKGEHIHDIIHKLESFGHYNDLYMSILVDKSLITMSKGILQMHDLLQKMGQKIVHCESAEEPGARSRLWCNEDVIGVLKNNTGTNAVRGIVLILPLRKQYRLSVEAFSKMKKLKMLQIRFQYLYYGHINLDTNVEWHGDRSNFMLSNELCVMEWCGYPLVSLPTNFQSDNLVELRMPYSCIQQLWDGRKSFDKLKLIHLSNSKNLIETPDLSGVPNLEKLELDYCTSLCKVHPSIGFLKRLKDLHLQGCKRLKRLPDEMISLSSLVYLDISLCSRLEEIPKNMISGMKCLEYLLVGGSATRKFLISSEPYRLLIPNSFSCLSSLRSLELGFCNLSDGAIPSDFSYLSSLRRLNLSGNKFARIPYSVWQLSNLIWLDLSYCNLLDGAIPNDLSCLSSLNILELSGNKFTRIPYSVRQLSSLKCLNLSYCNLLDGAIPNDLSCLSSLYSLKLSGNKFSRIPDSVAQLSNLGKLKLDDCCWLQVLPKLPLELTKLSVRNCPALELFYNKQMEIMWRSSNEILRSIDCSVVQAYIDYDGKPYKILQLHPRSPLWSKESIPSFGPIACGPTLVGSGIPEWFNDKSTNSFGTIQLHTDLGFNNLWECNWEWKGYVVFIVYEFHEPHGTHPRKRRKLTVHERKGNLTSTTFGGTHPNFPIFVCQFQQNGVNVTKTLVLCAPGVPSVGPNGFWVYISKMWFFKKGVLDGWRPLEASITTTGSLNVEVMECGARVVRDEHDASELCQLLNTISPCASGFKSYENLASLLDKNNCCMSLQVKGPIITKSNVVASGSIGSVNCQDLLKKKRKKKRGISLTDIQRKQKTLTFPSMRIRSEPTKKRRRKAHE